jgi:mono/diheme cytochrome c family protein
VKAHYLLLGTVALSALAACRGQTSRDEPIVGIRNMYDQVKYDIQEESKFFPDRRTMRPIVDGVVSHDQETDPAIAQGRLDDGSGYVLEIPEAVVARHGGREAMLKRGQARYGIYCAPCHDGTGSGEGMVKKRAIASGAAAFVPPTFHQDRIRHIPDGQLFATITNGKSNMPPYAMQIPVDDRWAIVGYVRVLQMAQPKLPTQAPLAPTSQGNLGPPPGGTASAQANDHQPKTTPTGSPSAMPAGSASTGASAMPPSTPLPEKKP